MHDAGEMDVRACYTAISVSTLSCLLSPTGYSNSYAWFQLFPFVATEVILSDKTVGASIPERKVSLEKLAEKG